MDELRKIYADKRVGERFEFGRYPQGTDGEVMPIVWQVLKREKDRLLIIAAQGLDCKPYNDRYLDTDWFGCSLRRWLNGEFFNKAFDKLERSLVRSVRNSGNAGSAADDRVFLLSIEEFYNLLSSDESFDWSDVNEKCVAEPTAFAVKNGVYKSDCGYCCWWLRSRGEYAVNAASVDAVGDVAADIDVTAGDLAVRPAMKLSL